MQAAEIDYMLFAYDRMFNHIEDVLFPLGTPMALGSLECATVFTAALVKMKAKLQEYHDKTNIPFFGRVPSCKYSYLHNSPEIGIASVH